MDGVDLAEMGSIPPCGMDPYVFVGESFSRRAPMRKAPRRKSTEIREKPARVRRAKAEPAETGLKVLRKWPTRWTQLSLISKARKMPRERRWCRTRIAMAEEKVCEAKGSCAASPRSAPPGPPSCWAFR